MHKTIDIDVAVIGGGGVGLTLSSFLSNENVDHVLFEKHTSTSPHLKAHYLNQRTMEIFRVHSMDKDILKQGCPPHNMSRVEWRTSLGGDGPFDRRLLGHLEAAGGREGSPQAAMYRKDSAALATNLPLLRLEPILRKMAEERNPGRVLFEHQVIDFNEEDDRVIVTVQTPSGDMQRYRAKYVVAADAGKLSTTKLGIKLEGPTALIDFVSIHFKADLSDYCDDRTLITHFINPEGESMAQLNCGALLQMGPTWGRRSEEWVLTFGFSVSDDSRFDNTAMPGKVRQLLKLPDLDMEILNVTHWELSRVVADKYRVGRVFIAGDAAHRRPPTTGLGLNTGIEDAQNIAWKLAQVLSKKANPKLLDTYEAERRPVGIRNSDWAFFTFCNMQVLTASIGIIPGAKEHNFQRFVRIFEDSEYGRTALHHIRRILGTQDVEYSAHDIELGFNYAQGACVSDSFDGPVPDPQGQIYVPSTVPGYRLPHAWIGLGAKKLSTHDLLAAGNYDFMLITDEFGSGWVDATRQITERSNLRIGAAQIRTHVHTPKADMYTDETDDWNAVKGYGKGGAVLVRPDNFVAWRRNRESGSPEDDLNEALQRLLGHVV